MAKGFNIATMLAKSGRLGGETDVAKVTEKLNNASVAKTGFTIATLLAKTDAVKSHPIVADASVPKSLTRPSEAGEPSITSVPNLTPPSYIEPLEPEDNSVSLIAESFSSAVMSKLKDDGATSFIYTPKIHTEKLSVSDTAVGMDGNSITYSERQMEAINAVANGESVIIIGPAGSGKTTCSRGAINAVIDGKAVGRIPAGHKYIPEGTPGIVICAFTRRSVNNIRKVAPPALKNSCITVHKLLEYEPTIEWDDAKGKEVKRFKPKRNKTYNLPSEIKVIVIEESGMLSVELHKQLIAALPNPDDVQFIYLGDLCQLPPPMGDAILGYKMNELRTIELDRVYRTGADSPITSFAWDIKSGKVIPELSKKDPSNPLRKCFPHFDKLNAESNGVVTLKAWQNPLTPFSCNQTAATFMIREFKEGRYDPEEDVILIPFERAFTRGSHEEMVSTINVNNLIAGTLSKERGDPVHEIIARGQKYYYAVGDKVLVDKEDGYIEDIKINPKYIGELPQEASVNLSRTGVNTDGVNYMEAGEVDIDLILDSMADSEDDVTNAASHIIVVRFGDVTREISNAGGISGMLLGYAITVYKAQGSEWRNVYGIIHKSHAVALNNEMLYTLVTRAKESLTILCEANSFYKGVQSRQIKGTTLEEKAAFFRMKTKEEIVGTHAKVIASMGRKKGQPVQATVSSDADVMSLFNFGSK